MATELHAASRAGDEARVARLIEAKDIDVNAQDGIGRTAFYLGERLHAVHGALLLTFA